MKKQNLLLCGIAGAALLILGGYRLVNRVRSDITPPEISFASETLTLSVKAPEEAYFAGVTAEDKRAGDVSDTLVIESIYGMNDAGETTVTYAAFDAAGNAAKASRTVLYEDYRAPQFDLRSPLVYEVGTVFDVLGDVTAGDIIDGDLSDAVKATMTTSGTTVEEEGIHEVLFRVTNSIGDTETLSLPVEVVPVDTYSADLLLKNYLLYLPLGATFEPESHLSSMRVRGMTIDLSKHLPSGVSLRVAGDVDTTVPGTYPVSYTTGYTVDGTVYTGYSKLFVVVRDNLNVFHTAETETH